MTGRPTGVTMVSAAHGSFLTCHRRLGCTSKGHAARRAAYRRAASERYNRRRGVQPAQLGRTHGIRATYKVCTDGVDGGACEPCRAAEAAYMARYRARRR